MERSGLHIARKVLGILHDVDELDLKHPDLMQVLDNDRFEGSAVLNYNLDRSPPVQLPDATNLFAELIKRHLCMTNTSDPWGFVGDKLIMLKLEDHPHSKCGKLLLFGLDYISELLDKLFPNAGITIVERRIMLQSLSGITLKQAAEIDNVSYETKKSQLKNVFQKTQINSQQTLSNFLITHLTLELAARVSRRPANAESDEMFFHYVDTYMGKYVRASVVQESKNRRFRIIELGDPAGMPVVCVHHLGIINYSEKEIDEIYRNRIRLICPLRHGALGPSDPKITLEQQSEHAIAGIDLAISLTGQKSATVLSLLSGSFYAINYFEKYPDKVKKLIMLAASYKSHLNKKVTSVLRNNLHSLASEHERTLELTVAAMLENVDQPSKLKNVVKESNNNNGADNRVIDKLFADEKQVKAMQHRLRNSPLSIVQDLKIQSTKDWSPLQRNRLESEIHFIHGSEDKLIPIEDIENLVEQRSEMQLHVVEGAGNWIFGEYTRQTSSIIREIIEDSL